MSVNHASSFKRRRRQGAQIVCGAQSRCCKKKKKRKKRHFSRCKQRSGLNLAVATPWKKGWHFWVWPALFLARRSRFKHTLEKNSGLQQYGATCHWKSLSRRILRLYATEVSSNTGVYFCSLAGIVCVFELFALQSKQQGRRGSCVFTPWSNS